MSERLNLRNLFALAIKVDDELQRLKGPTSNGEIRERIGLDPSSYRDAQKLDQALELLSVIEQLQGVSVDDQRAQKKGLLPFHWVVNKITRKPGAGYYRWFRLVEINDLEGGQ